MAHQLNNGKVQECKGCLMGEFIDDLLELKDVQRKTALATAKLASTLDNINANLDRGFRLGEKIVVLFGKIVFVFLATVAALCLVIVFIAKMDISYQDLSIKAGPRSVALPTPIPAPVVPEVHFPPTPPLGSAK